MGSFDMNSFSVVQQTIDDETVKKQTLRDQSNHLLCKCISEIDMDSFIYNNKLNDRIFQNVVVLYDYNNSGRIPGLEKDACDTRNR